MSARRPSFLPRPLAWLPSSLIAALFTLLAPPFDTAHAGMIGTGLSPRVVVFGDLNEDTYPDLVSGNAGDSTVSVSLGRGNGTYAPKVQYVCGHSVNTVVIADLNGDNHLDVISGCVSINRVGIRFGAGDGTLGARTDYIVNTPVAIAAADLNADGLVDLAIGSYTSLNLNIMLATGPGTFGPVSGYPGGTFAGIAVGDVDNDGDPDLVAPSALSTWVNVYLNNGSGVFGFPDFSPTTQGPSAGVSLADFNHDGRLDIALPIPGSSTVNVLLGTGGGAYGPYVSYATGASPSGIDVGDANGDTHPDIAASANGANAVSVLLGTGSGTFSPKVDYPAGLSPYGVAFVQFDADPALDLALAASASNSICTLPGNGDGTFQIPSGPVYVWAPASGLAYDPASWLPARNASSTSDILVFNRGGVVTVSSVPTATIGQLVFSGGTEASFSGFFGASTLTVAGGSGYDAAVELGSKAILANAGNPVTVNIASGANAAIDGDVEIRGGNNRFQAVDVHGIWFRATGRAIIGPGSSTTPFGNGTGASGTRSVLFHYGSSFIAQAPVAVFGGSYPVAVVDLWPGSRFRMDVAFNPDVSGRTYGDFEYNVPSGTSALTGSSPLILDSLIVSQGTLSVEMTGGVTIHGNIVVPTCSGPNRLVFAPTSPATYQLGGTTRQHLYSPQSCPGNLWRAYSSANVTWDIANPAGVEFTQPWRTTSNFNFTQGTINTTVDPGNFWGWQLVLDSTATVTGASQSTGWFTCPLVRRAVPNSGWLNFDVGDSANYLLMAAGTSGATVPGYFQAATAYRDHPDIGNAQLDLNHVVHRTWMLVASNDFGGFQAPTFFTNTIGFFSYVESDWAPGTDFLQFVMRKRQASPPWEATTFGGVAINAIAADNLPASGMRTSLFAAGIPITPSLSVSNASSPEGNGSGLRIPAPDEQGSGNQTLVGPSDAPLWADGADVVAPWLLTGERVQPSLAATPSAETQTAGSLSFRVRLSQGAVVPIDVDYQTADGTATVADGDYTPTSGTLHFAPGDTALDVVVPFGADATPERNETFGITLTNATNAAIGTGAATGTILDDDDLIAPTVAVTYPNGGEVIHQNQQVNLTWTASDNVAVSGVDVILLNGGSQTVLATNYPNTGSYAWLSTGPASTKMRLRVVAHDDPGHTTIDNSDAVWEISPYTIDVDDNVPLAFALATPAPNPSPAGTNRITFSVPREAAVRLTIHDVRGRMLAKLADGVVPAGRHVRNWDSTKVSAGVYFIHFEAPGFRADERLIVVR